MTSTETEFSQPTQGKPEIPRDGWGRPLVLPPHGGKRQAYTRCTTYVGGIEDTWNLSRWSQRMVATGLSVSPDLQAAVADTPAEDKRRMDELCELAKDAGGGNDPARWGTYMHALTEAADRGEDTSTVAPPQLTTPRDPGDAARDLAAYLEATADLKHRLIEAFTVQDPLRIGGTPDRVVEYRGKRYIADLKTGSINYGSLKIAAQLAVYARSQPYDIGSDQRTDPHGASVERGIVIHLPPGSGTCTLVWVDLLAGWEAVRVCRQIREQRKVKARDLFRPWDEPIPAEPVADGETLYPQENASDRGARQVEAEALTPKAMAPTLRADVAPTPQTVVASAIAVAFDVEAVRDLWRRNTEVWTPDLTEAAKARIAALQ